MNILIVALLLSLVSVVALAQVGLPWPGPGGIAGPAGTPCATSFVFDWSDATGCNGITMVIR